MFSFLISKSSVFILNILKIVVSSIISKVNNKIIVDKIYQFGYLEGSSEQKNEQTTLTLRKGNEIQEIQLHKLFLSNQIAGFIQSNIGKQPFTQTENDVINIIQKELKPNVSYDENFSQKILNENLNKISYTKGLISENERIIFKGDIVEGNKFIALNSLKNE